MKTIDVYQDMTPREIAETFNKSINAVNVGISRMVKDNPTFKIKTGKRVTITAAGVEWLATKYFNIQTQLVVPDPEKDELKRQVARLNELLEQSKVHYNQLSEIAKATIEENTRQHQLELKVSEEELKKTQDQLHQTEQELKTSNEELNKFKKKKILGFEYYIKEKEI